jgi:hypothetical protein
MVPLDPLCPIFLSFEFYPVRIIVAKYSSITPVMQRQRIIDAVWNVLVRCHFLHPELCPAPVIHWVNFAIEIQECFQTDIHSPCHYQAALQYNMLSLDDNNNIVQYLSHATPYGYSCESCGSSANRQARISGLGGACQVYRRHGCRRQAYMEVFTAFPDGHCPNLS